VAGTNQFTEQLEIEVEAIAGESEARETIRAHHLVHRSRIREARGKQCVEERTEQYPACVHAGGQQAVTGELADLPAGRPQVTTAEHERYAIFQDRPEQIRIVGDIVFQVSVLYEQDVAAGGGESLADRMSLAVRPVLIDRADAR